MKPEKQGETALGTSLNLLLVSQLLASQIIGTSHSNGPHEIKYDKVLSYSQRKLGSNLPSYGQSEKWCVREVMT